MLRLPEFPAVLSVFALSVTTAYTVHAADCNGNLIDDADELAAATSEDCNRNGLPDECETPLPAFTIDRENLFQSRILQLFSADFDGDGIVDLAAGRLDQFTLRLRAPEGGPREVETHPHFHRSFRIQAWAIGDVDGDGDKDALGLTPLGLWLLRNRLDGTFDPIVEIDGTNGGTHLTLGDANADGLDDVFVVNGRTQIVRILLVRPDGSLDAQREMATGDGPTRPIVGDVNGDGTIDLLVPNLASRDVSVFLGAGDGTFSTQAPLTIGHRLTMIIAADFNGDGRDDVAVAHARFARVYFSLAAGGFSAARDLVASNSTGAWIAPVDLDNDGDVDIVGSFTSPQGALIYLNRGGGAFNAAQRIPRSTLSGPLTVGDFDGDDRDDVAVVGSLKRSTVETSWNDGSQTNGDSFLFKERRTLSVNGMPHTIAAGDVDGDGDIDLATGNGGDGRVFTLVNNGAGEFRLEPHALFPARFVLLEDLDHDDDLDLVALSAARTPAGSNMRIYVNDGKGAFTQNGPGFYVGCTDNAMAADLDGDGFVDLIAGFNHLVGSGDATFSAQDTFESCRSVTIAFDADSDSDNDVAVLNRHNRITVGLNDGDAVFESTAFDVEGVDLAAADLDRDGFPDLVTDRSILWNRGNGEFEQPVPLDESMDFTAFSLLTADLDLDGFPDVVVTSQAGEAAYVLINRGDRSFAEATAFFTGSGPRFSVVADIDGDGAPDLITANRVGESLTIHHGIATHVQPTDDYVERLCLEHDFRRLSAPTSTAASSPRATKYIIPARDDSELLPSLFQNVNRFQLHEEFLRRAFPDRFPTLFRDEFERLVGRRATRDYYVGVLQERPEDPERPEFSFTAFADIGFDPRETLTRGEVTAVYERLRLAFTLGELVYRPDSDPARREAENWGATPFAIDFTGDGDSAAAYEPYTTGVSYGHVHVLTLEEFDSRSRGGSFTFRDIVVVDAAPRDIDSVVAALVTAAPQNLLSHTAVRMANRGTPNAFLASARSLFAPHAGELVRLELGSTDFSLEPASLEEAASFWERRRPSLPPLPAVDARYGELDALETIVAAGERDGVPLETRVGGKAASFARLQETLVGDSALYREAGFAIPLRYYLEFMRDNSVVLGGVRLSFQQILDTLLNSRELAADAAQRSAALESFRDLVRAEGVVDPALVARAAAKIEAVFGSTARMVRFRSSSNVEDLLEFNGAGLYESTSACAADTLDGVVRPGSFCDLERSNERTIERALKKVWASLWTTRAHEERTFFGISPDAVAMGVLVTRAFLDEEVNGVAFTGDPRNHLDRRYVVTAQVGELSVVSPEPGVRSERSLLEMRNGEVVRIIRDRSSSEVAADAVVMSDAHLHKLGALMAHVDTTMPINVGNRTRGSVLLDFEFKVERDGSLAVKQVRPFLVASEVGPSPSFTLRVADDVSACTLFSKNDIGRPPSALLATKSRVRLRAGDIELPSAIDTFSGELFDEVVFGPERELAVPDEPGRFRVVRLADAGDRTIYRFTFEQTFSLTDGRRFTLHVRDLRFRGRGGVAIDDVLLLDDAYVADGLTMSAEVDGERAPTYGPCSPDHDPLWQTEIALDDGASIRLVERYDAAVSAFSTAPASLVEANLRSGSADVVVKDYWRLVYTARLHNRNVRYWIVLEPALELDGIREPVHVIDVIAPEPLTNSGPEVHYLGDDFKPLASVPVRIYRRTEINQGTEFERGDVNGDGRVNLSDAIALLLHLFRGAAAPDCRKSADTNDDALVDLADAVTLLRHLFGGQAAVAAPVGSCGTDPTADTLGCASAPTCGMP